MFDSPIPDPDPDPHAMIPDINVNKEKNSTTLGGHILQGLSIVYRKHFEFSFQETKSLSSFAGLSGCQPTRKFTHS